MKTKTDEPKTEINKLVVFIVKMLILVKKPSCTNFLIAKLEVKLDILNPLVNIILP